MQSVIDFECTISAQECGPRERIVYCICVRQNFSVITKRTMHTTLKMATNCLWGHCNCGMLLLLLVMQQLLTHRSHMMMTTMMKSPILACAEKLHYVSKKFPPLKSL